MTHREVARAHFPNLAPTLVADHTAIVLTPAADNRRWAVEVSWQVARALARAGRRVVLIDLDLENPSLGEEARDTVEEGIVDAFVFGVSLSHVAREQEPDLYFIGVGSATQRPEEVWSSPRWGRLAKGFQSEGALLLLFLPPAALRHLGLEPDGMIVAAPGGYDPASGTFPDIPEMLRRGSRLVAVIREGPPRRPAPPRSFVTRRRTRPQIGYVLLAAGVAALAAAALLPRSPDRATPFPVSSRSVPAAATAAIPGDRAVATGDSLFYSVQVAAYNTLSQAVAHARELEGTAGIATVAPVRLGSQGLWYRVMAGALPTPLAADSLLRRLWSRGMVTEPNGTILRTPYTHLLPSEHGGSPSARALAAYQLQRADGTARLFAGAFEGADQAAIADSIFQAEGMRATLVRRSGARP